MKIFYPGIAVAVIMAFFTGCNSVKISMDVSGMNDISKAVLRDHEPGTPAGLAAFLDKADIKTGSKACENISVTVEPLARWNLELESGVKVRAEKISFRSGIMKNAGNDAAVFYLYHSPAAKERRVILWVPGFGVSDFAFNFIQKFFKIALLRGYDVLFYNIPFHLERAEKGRKEGEGLFAAGAEKNVEMTMSAIREIRTITAYLRGTGVKTIGGWGGSIGASYLLLAASIEKFDHLCLMIPVVDWNTILTNPAMKDVLDKNVKNGFEQEMMKRAYDIISPVNYRFMTAPERIQILIAKYDQLTPEKRLLEFADKFHIMNVREYEESHSTILLNEKMYGDYSDFISSIQ